MALLDVTSPQGPESLEADHAATVVLEGSPWESKPSSSGAATLAGSNPQDDRPDPQDKLAAEFNTLQQNTKRIAIIGSRNIPLPHQQLIENLAYELAKSGNTIITSGGSSGPNAAAIRGAMRANPKLLTVILPQTIGQQPSDVQDQLIGIPNIKEHPEWQMMPLADASRLCNREIIDQCEQLILFLFHNSNTLKQAIEYAEDRQKIVTAFYLD